MRLKKFRADVRTFIQYTPDPLDESAVVPKPPYEMQLLWKCETYNTLPERGGLMDQPHILMMLFNIIHEERAEWRKVNKINQQLHAKWESSSDSKRGK